MQYACYIMENNVPLQSEIILRGGCMKSEDIKGHFRVLPTSTIGRTRECFFFKDTDYGSERSCLFRRLSRPHQQYSRSKEIRPQPP